MTSLFLAQLNPDQKQKFEMILEQRVESDVLTRIDTLSYDYAFISETICYSNRKQTMLEIYFQQIDSAPSLIFENRKIIKPDQIQPFRCNARQTIARYNALFPIQTISYHHRYVSDSSNLRKEKRSKVRELKTTYRIEIMLDKKNKKVVVSIQTPPDNPEIVVSHYLCCKRFL